jgi:hypothetical protein
MKTLAVGLVLFVASSASAALKLTAGSQSIQIHGTTSPTIAKVEFFPTYIISNDSKSACLNAVGNMNWNTPTVGVAAVHGFTLNGEDDTVPPIRANVKKGSGYTAVVPTTYTFEAGLIGFKTTCTAVLDAALPLFFQTDGLRGNDSNSLVTFIRDPRSATTQGNIRCTLAATGGVIGQCSINNGAFVNRYDWSKPQTVRPDATGSVTINLWTNAP